MELQQLIQTAREQGDLSGLMGHIPYARLIGMDKNLEEAAMDLGATYWSTLARITLPIAFPAMVAAFLVSFTTSFDEFALAFFLIGPEPTLPVYIYSQLRFPSRLPIIVTMASVIMVVSVLMIVFSEYLRRWGSTPARPRSEGAQ